MAPLRHVSIVGAGRTHQIWVEVSHTGKKVPFQAQVAYLAAEIEIRRSPG